MLGRDVGRRWHARRACGRGPMQTIFTAEQLRDPDVAESEKILRRCVHCGFCTATCPTYVLLGDELDSPRGRIYLIKDMLENDRPASEQVVKHIDRCLSCLACMTTCPSDVHYMHLVDHARRHIEATYRRPLPDRLLRAMLATVLPRPWLFRLALLGAWLGKPFARFLPGRAQGHARARAGASPDALAGRPAAGVSGRGAAARPRRAAQRLRPAGAGAGDQRGHDPPADPARRRGGGRQGRRLLRRAHPPSGQGAAGAARRQGQHRRLDARARGRGPRCRGDQRLGLRNHGQGLRVHAAGGPRLCRQGRPHQRASRRTSPS